MRCSARRSAAAAVDEPVCSAISKTVSRLWAICWVPLTSLVFVIATGGEFAGKIDYTSGVNDVVWGVEDVMLGKPVSIFGCGELIVGGAGNDTAVEVGDGPFIEQGSACAGRKDVARDFE